MKAEQERLKNLGGRPRTVENPTPVSTSVDQHAYDRLCQIAHKNRQSVSSVVRDIISRGLQQNP